MVCIYCGADTRVTNSRPQKRLNQIWRRRQCINCRAIFSTTEISDYEHAWAVKSVQGTLSPFLREKLFISIYKSCQHRPAAISDAYALTATCISKLAPIIREGVIEPKDIAHTISAVLNRFDGAAHSHYQAFHPIQNKKA